MKKLLGIIIFTFLAIFSLTANSAFALVFSQDEALDTIDKLDTIASADLFSMVNKSELIGIRYENFTMLTKQYQSEVLGTANLLRDKLNKINIILNSADYSDTEKQMQSNALYQEINLALNTIDTRTMNYIFALRDYMPSITYQRYNKRFSEYYNSFDITDTKVNIY